MLVLAATGIHRGNKQCQIFLRLLGWNDKPPTPIQIIQACAVAAFEKLCGAQMSWLPNVPEMELYGVERCGFSMFFWYTQKHPKTARCEKWWPSLGIGVRHSHRSSEMVPEVPTWTNKNTPDLPLRAAARFKHKKQIGCDMMWPNSFNRVGFRSHQISHPSIPVAKALLLTVPSPSRRRHGLHDGRPWPGSLYGEVERPAEVGWVIRAIRCFIWGCSALFWDYVF